MRISDELKSELEKIRGEPLEVRDGGAAVPHNETSDPHHLCRHPVVSVCMLTYNHEKYLQQAIDGVMEQKTDFEYELVIAEDCSTDGTRRICFENQARYPDRVRVLWSDSNVGVCRNGDRMLAASRGEFVAFCEGDDYWVNPLKLQKQVDLMRWHPTAGICFGGNDIYYEFNGSYSRYEPSRAPKGFFSGREFCWRLMFEKGDKGFHHQDHHTSTFLVRRSALTLAVHEFEDAFLWKLRQGDFTLMTTIAGVADVCFLNELCSVYRVNDSGIMRSVGSRVNMDGDFLKIYLCMRIFGWSFDKAFEAFSDLLAIRWTKMALETSGDAQKALAAAIARSESLSRAFSRWYCRSLFAAMKKGTLSRKRYKLLRLLYALGSHFNKMKVRRRLRKTMQGGVQHETL